MPNMNSLGARVRINETRRQTTMEDVAEECTERDDQGKTRNVFNAITQGHHQSKCT
jgi:hypothetical protein